MIKFSTEPHGVDRSRIQVCINQAQPDALRPPGRRLSDRRRESHCVRGGGICTWAPARFLSTRRRAPRRMSGLPATNRAWRVGHTSADTRHGVARWRSQTTAVHAGCTALRRLYARMPHWSTRPSRPVLGCRLVRTVVLQVLLVCTVLYIRTMRTCIALTPFSTESGMTDCSALDTCIVICAFSMSRYHVAGAATLTHGATNGW